MKIPNWTKTNKFKFACIGIAFGFVFPCIAILHDLNHYNLAFSWANAVAVQVDHPIHFIIDTAPIFLGLFAFACGMRQDKIQRMNKELRKEIKEKMSFYEKLEQTTAEKSRLENELEIARDIQQSMLPKEFATGLDNNNLDAHAALIPAKEVGGDFYDFFSVDDDHVCLVVGDVSGKGVPAALMMAVCQTLIRSRASVDRSTGNILTYVNQEMAKNNPNHMFVTVFIAILNIHTHELLYSNAGHNPTYIKQAYNQKLKALTQLNGPVIGAMEGLIYTEQSVALGNGDFIFAYTDGITEAHNTTGELFSSKRLEQILGQSHQDSTMMVNTVIKEAQTFELGNNPFDDMTALCVRLNESKGGQSLDIQPKLEKELAMSV